MPVPSLQDLLTSLGLTNEQYTECHHVTTGRNMVIFKRHPNDAWVNPYNETLLTAWDGNIDIQPILDPYSCIMYVISYITKAEHELGDLLKRVQKELQEGNLDPYQQLRQLGNVFVQNRDISLMECVYRVTSMPLKRTSRQVVFLPSDPYAAR